MLTLAPLQISADRPAPQLSRKEKDAACDLGRAIFSDPHLFDPVSPGTPVRFDAQTGTGGASILSICPDLQRRLPADVPLASKADRARVGKIASPSITLVYVAMPVFGADATHATIAVGQYCNGLCGHGAAYPYVRVQGHWQRDGNPTTVWDS